MSEYEAKIAALVEAMKDQEFEPVFKGDAAKARNTLELHLNTMSAYLDRVYEQESIERRMVTEGGAELRSENERANERRTSAHNAAMSSLNVVNRIFDAYGLPPFIAVVPDQNRSEIGENIAACIGCMFLGMNEGATRTNVAFTAHERGIGHARREGMLSEMLDGLFPSSR